MNKTYTLSVITLIFLSAFQVKSFSQATVTSTTGYTVTLNVYPSAVVPASSTCQNGYNYKVKMNYAISITGPNAPSSLYTLQGTIGCGSSSIFYDLPNNGGTGNVLSSNAWTSSTNCATVTPATMGCNTVKIEIHGPGISSRIITYNAAAAAASTLGIKLMNFSANLENTRVKIKWATASEENNEYLSIERSTDGNQWTEVKREKGAGNSNTVLSYEAYDNAPVAGTSFYRLKQTDFDGKTSLSDIQVVKYSPTAKGITVFPVPNTGNTITISGISNYSNYDFTLLNANGNIVYNTKLSQSSVNLPQLQSGVYVIRLKDKVSGEAQNMRYVKI
jgi:hypothetical protein